MKYFTTYFILFGTLLSSLESLEVKTKLHVTEISPHNNFKEFLGQYYTEINYDDWPENRRVEVFEKRSTYPKERKINCLKSNSGITLVIGSIGYYPGESTLFTLKDNTLTESVKIIPNPIQAKSSDDDAHANVVLQNLFSFKIVLKGFKKNEKVLLEFSSYDEKIKHSITFSEDMTIDYMPQVIGKKSGFSKLNITRASGEVLTMTIPWGEELLKCGFYYDEKGRAINYLEYKEANKVLQKKKIKWKKVS